MDHILQQVTAFISANQFLQGGLVLGMVTSVLYQLKSIPMQIYRKVKSLCTYQVYFDDTGDFYRYFAQWFNETYPHKFKNVEVRFEEGVNSGGRVNPRTTKDDSKTVTVHTYQYSDRNLIWFQGRPLFIRKTRDQLQNANDRHTMHLNSYTVSGFFAKKAIAQLCSSIRDRRIDFLTKDTLTLKTWDGSYWEGREVEIVKTFDHIFFDGKQSVITDLDQFTLRRDFYRTRGINYKRSFLFYGPGGTGKTSISTAIAKHLNYDLYVINLASIKNDDALQAMGRTISSGAVILLEDIDCVLQNRKVDNKDLNFSTVLNFLDGVHAPSDCVFVMTTNKPEVLDEALTRKGRVDVSMLVDFPRVVDIEEYMSDFYGQPVRMDIAGCRSDVPMASIQDICLRHPDVNEATAAVAAHLVPLGKAKIAA